MNNRTKFATTREELRGIAIKNETFRNFIVESAGTFDFTGLRLIPIVNLTTINDAAEYFSVPVRVIRETVQKNKEEFVKELVECNVFAFCNKLKNNGYEVFGIKDKSFSYKIGENLYKVCGKYLLTKGGIARLALLIPKYYDVKGIVDQIIGSIIIEDRELTDTVSKRNRILTTEEKKILQSDIVRSEYIKKVGSDDNALSLLNQYKEVEMIEGFGYLTFNMIADYLEVSRQVLQDKFYKHPFDFSGCVAIARPLVCTMFTPMAIIKFAMLLKDYAAAQTIRRRLIFNYCDVPVMTEDEDVNTGKIRELKLKINEMKAENEKLLTERQKLKDIFLNISSSINLFNNTNQAII